MTTPAPRRLPLLLLVLLLPLGSGCVGLVAGAGVGFLISQQVLPNDVHVAQIRMEAHRAWPGVTEALSFFVDPGEELVVQDYPRVARAKVGGAKVTVEVEAHDENVTLVRVGAERYFTADNDTAETVMRKILERLSR